MDYDNEDIKETPGEDQDIVCDGRGQIRPIQLI